MISTVHWCAEKYYIEKVQINTNCCVKKWEKTTKKCKS